MKKLFTKENAKKALIIAGIIILPGGLTMAVIYSISKKLRKKYKDEKNEKHD